MFWLSRGSTKPQNSYFLVLFYANTKTHKETNSADVGPVEDFVASAKRVGLVSSCVGCLHAQSGYKLKSCFGVLVFRFATSLFRGLVLWNNLDPFLKSSRSVQVFERILKNKLLDNFVNTS